ncbi:copper chaperone PCu(A)C [Alteromonas sp. ASW11-36]|uniref:Copper chaperone PCu(A)C n=1 Tax=Alteromonas arenosi TaxID=3055817 RepID=A0ABT7SZC9_9ALTE|nr:copper chaperone PCu(A)C [Alteromonas sp. ASW11-36]MDM7861551.1 copper chaperone PCu(A)C [Alteromonas sp. ASW11-36]
MARILILLLVLFCVIPVNAHDYRHDSFEVDHPWARPTFAMATTGAVYLSLTNVTESADTVTGVSVPTTIAREAQLHDVLMDGDIMRMRHMEQGLVVEPAAKVDFAPSGKHIMLLGLTGPLELGQEFPLTLHFAQAEDLDVTVYVEQPEKSDDEVHHNH